MTRALCESCLESFDAEALASVDGRRLCPGCRGRPVPVVSGASPGLAGGPEPGNPRGGGAPDPAGVPPVARVVEPPTNLFVRLRDEAAAWCVGRSWAVRLPLLAWFAYILVRHWADADYHSLFLWLNFGIHELGHPLFSWFGEFPGMAGGTLLQCLVPVLSMGMFYRQRDFFAIAACFGWLSTNLFYCGWYAADASAMAVPLLSPFGGDVRHDWNYLLGATGLLAWDGTVAFLFRTAASLAMLVSLAAGGWLVWRMARPVRLDLQGASPDNADGARRRIR